MKLKLVRKYPLSNYTIGKLYIDDVYFCDTLEDTDRNLDCKMDIIEIKAAKIYAKTAIPYGKYDVTLSIRSPKFAQKSQYFFCSGYLPRLIGVPGYEGVLIHIGNKPEDTEGCILVGENKVKGQVINSTATFKKLYQKLKTASIANEIITLQICRK